MKWARVVLYLSLLFLATPQVCFGSVILEQETKINRIDLPASFSTYVSARVGGYLFDIEGLTSPWARVEFASSQGNVNLETIADDQGVFRFYRALMPLSTGDLCFSAIDTQQRASTPLCFPPPPAHSYTNIRGIILPPTLALEKGVFLQGENNAAYGATTPDSPVRIFLFEDENVSFWQLLDALPFLVGAFPNQVLAREGPPLSVETNTQGEFSFNLPTYKSTVWKMFAGTQKTQLGENPSPQSNTIQFVALSWWQWWLLKILSHLKEWLDWLIKFLSHPLVIITLLVAAIGIMIRLLSKRQGNCLGKF